MKSIKTKLIISYFIIIFVLVAASLSIMCINNNLLSKYKRINDNVVIAHELKESVWRLVEDYYNCVKSRDYDKYYQRLDEIRGFQDILERSMTEKEVKAAYRGVKNSLENLVSETEAAKQSWEEGNIEGISSTFQEASRKLGYVKENVNAFILAETDYLARVTINTQKSSQILNAVIAGGLIATLIGITVFAFVFARHLTTPLIKLSGLAETIGDGNLEQGVSRDLKDSDDEIGQLARRFDQMRIELKKRNDIAIKDRNQLLKSLLDVFKGKFGNIATILVRRDLKKLVEKNPRIMKMIPKGMAASIRKEQEHEKK